jgi:endo-1,4-beta-D-glucanase Y
VFSHVEIIKKLRYFRDFEGDCVIGRAMLERTARVATAVLFIGCTHQAADNPDSSMSGSGTGGSVSANGGNNAATTGGVSSVATGGTGNSGSITGGTSSAGGKASGGTGGTTLNTGGSANTSSGGAVAVAGAGGGSAGQGPFPDPPGTVGAPFKFPQNLRSANCAYPSQARAAEAKAAYDRWKTELVTADGAGGFRRVRRPNNENDTTVSEGIGYGMILAVAMDDQTLFDDLWKYEQKYLNENGLMNWEIGSDGNVTMQGKGAATDADEDMAWALALADKKWSGKGSLATDYLSLAKQQIDKIWNHEVDHGRGELLLAGDSWGMAVPYNPSYFAPNQYRLFAKLSGNTGWNKVIDKGYEMLNKTLTSANGNLDNGLVPAWTNDAGVPTPAFMGAPTHYQYDSARTPFRIGMDYCDFGEARAKAYLAKTSTFFSGLGASNIVDGYNLNGSPKAENTMPAGIQSALFVGAPGVGAMSDARFQSFTNDTYKLLTTKEMLPPSYYFNLSWQVFSLLMMTGNLFDYTLH